MLFVCVVCACRCEPCHSRPCTAYEFRKRPTNMETWRTHLKIVRWIVRSSRRDNVAKNPRECSVKPSWLNVTEFVVRFGSGQLESRCKTWISKNNPGCKRHGPFRHALESVPCGASLEESMARDVLFFVFQRRICRR